MAYTTINKSTDYFDTTLWTGNATARNITTPFQPDFTWIKPRSFAENHVLFDAVRGATKRIISNTTDVEATNTTMLTAFNSTSFSIGTNNNVNKNSDTFVAWNWKAGGGQGSSNTAGSINTTYTSVNTTAGFSISQYTGTGSAGATVGHGLGVAPKMIIVKGLTFADVWIVGGDNLGGWNKEMYLNSTSAVATNNNAFNGVAPTSSVFTLGSGNGTNKSGDTYIAYCFAEKQGYSKFGSYTGNGNANGTFVYTGFKPAFLMMKRTDNSNHFAIYDNKRNGFNTENNYLRADGTYAEGSETWGDLDILSNGFKPRAVDGMHNASGGTYIYMAFGQTLVGSNKVPCTAR